MEEEKAVSLYRWSNQDFPEPIKYLILFGFIPLVCCVSIGFTEAAYIILEGKTGTKKLLGTERTAYHYVVKHTYQL